MIVRFSISALADIQSLHDYIAKENPTAAKRVVSAIERATDRLSMFPLSGRKGAVETTRELIIPRVPYIAVYIVRGDSVDIIAVFHAAQGVPRG
jgi:toxin ParE1/3/4